MQGQIKLSSRSTRSYISYTVKIDDTWFAVSQVVFYAFEQFQRTEPDAIIYYAPASKTLLSFEPYNPG